MTAHIYKVRVTVDADVVVSVLAHSQDEALDKASEVATEVLYVAEAAFRDYGSGYGLPPLDEFEFEFRTDRVYAVDVETKERLCAED